jgi:hypothetical protein
MTSVKENVMSKQVKIPKRIAGLKIPKTVRKGPVVEFLNSSAGQLVLAQVLLAIGARYAVKHTDPESTSGKTIRHPVQTLRTLSDDVGERADEVRARFARACTAAAQAFRSAMEDGQEELPLASEATSNPNQEEEPRAKKSQVLSDDARPH